MQRAALVQSSSTAGCTSRPSPSPSGHFVKCLPAQRSQKRSFPVSGAVEGISVASTVLSTVSDGDVGTLTTAVGGTAALVGLGVAVFATDPQKRREQQMQEKGGDEMAAVREYFNTEGFNRWKKIYGTTDEVNKVQLDIREGHAQTIDKVLNWLDTEGGVEGETFCDAGCGTGSLSIPLASRGALLSASDISSAMTSEAQARWEDAKPNATKTPSKDPVFETKDLESISGKYDNVACLDVMIHYPEDKMKGMVEHLAGLADKKLLISFAPKTFYYVILKRIGELFPGPSKATRAYLHAEGDVETALNNAGWKVVKRDMTATSFYFSRLLEAVPM